MDEASLAALSAKDKLVGCLGDNVLGVDKLGLGVQGFV